MANSHNQYATPEMIAGTHNNYLVQFAAFPRVAAANWTCSVQHWRVHLIATAESARPSRPDGPQTEPAVVPTLACVAAAPIPILAATWLPPFLSAWLLVAWSSAVPAIVVTAAAASAQSVLIAAAELLP